MRNEAQKPQKLRHRHVHTHRQWIVQGKLDTATTAMATIYLYLFVCGFNHLRNQPILTLWAIPLKEWVIPLQEWSIPSKEWAMHGQKN